MKKLLSLLIFIFITNISYGQVFTQTFVDRCTGDVKVVTANFVNGSATVAFYDKIRTFTYQQYLNGELQAWLIQTYNWWQALSPCSSTTTQVQQAQQTAQTAQQAAQTAQSAASTASSAASTASSAASSATNATTTTPPPNTNTTATTTGGGTNETTTTTTNQSTESSGGTNTEAKTTTESKTGETTSETSDGGGGDTSESKTEDAKSDSSESNKEENSSDESNSEDSGDSEEVKEEESKEETKKEEKKEEKKKKEKVQMMPIQLKADAMAMQNPLGGFNSAINFGASRSSIFGDVSYTANLMVFDNLRQGTLSLGRAKIYMDESYNVDWIESIGLSYGNNFETQSTSGNIMRLKPMGKWGVAGVGVNYTFMFGGMLEKPMGSMGYNILYTNTYVRPDNRWTYAPAFIISQTPLSFTLDRYSTISKDAMFILANSFTYRLTKRFTVNFGYTAIKSTNPLIPLISSFMIGSKLPF